MSRALACGRKLHAVSAAVRSIASPRLHRNHIRLSTVQSAMASTDRSEKFRRTSGARDPVWVHGGSYADRPDFPTLREDLETDVCIVGAGISGISIAYELIQRGKSVVLLDARDVLSGETGRTSGHLSNALDDGYVSIKNTHGEEGARVAAESHSWAIQRVGELARKHNIECEYRQLPAFRIPEHPFGTEEHKAELEETRKDVELAAKYGIDAKFDNLLTIKGWGGKIDQRGGGIYAGQATFHPTNYLIGLLNYLKQQPGFKCFTNSRVMTVQEKGIELLGLGHKSSLVETVDGHAVKCEFAVEATDVPLQKLSIIAQMEYDRTYCIAIRVPKGSVQDCLIYDSADPYKYVRLAKCDDKDDFMVVGGCDHPVAQESPEGRFEELEQWTRERFPQAGSVEHGVLAGKLIADEITGEPNSWVSVYSPKRIGSVVKSAPSIIAHDLQVNTQYKRWLQSDITDIEDLMNDTGGVYNPKTGSPVAIYKDKNGAVTKLSAVCPHMQGVVCWNDAEKSWDCPVHGSRFGADGTCVQGPAKKGLSAVEG
ncbi:FAD dependent oxidoreductase [Xylariaceae sp. FL1272]|nr:FAD dependent oxidoreductase [Xylariaceae sp. FL1272]